MERPAFESPSPETYRRLIAWPLAAAAGVLTAAVVVDRWHVSPVAGLGCGLVVLWLTTRVRNALEGRLTAALSDDPIGAGLALTMDILVGAGVGFAASRLLDSPVVGAVAAGAGLAGAWSFLLGQLFWGGGVDRAVDFLLGGAQSTDFAREPILADGVALEREGQPDAAIRKYREVAELRPREAEPYLRMARVLTELDRHAEATAVLREARRRARMTAALELLIGQKLADLAAGPLADPAAAIAELALIAQRFRGTPAGDAAARRVEELRATDGT